MIVGKHHRVGGGVRGTNQICETLASCLVVKNSCQGGEGEQAQTLLAWGQRQQEAVMRKTEGKAASNEAGRVEKVCTRRVTPTHWSRMLDGGGVHCRWVKCTDWQQRMQGESMDRGAKGKKATKQWNFSSGAQQLGHRKQGRAWEEADAGAALLQRLHPQRPMTSAGGEGFSSRRGGEPPPPGGSGGHHHRAPLEGPPCEEEEAEAEEERIWSPLLSRCFSSLARMCLP